MTKRTTDPKAETLRQRGCLHPHPDKVADELFTSNAFFDPRDLLQIKYEMLRRVRLDGDTISQTAARFGLSRPVFYQAQAAYAGRRPGRLAAQKTGAASCPQVVRGGHRDPARAAPPGATRQRNDTGRVAQGARGCLSPSAQHRACPGSTGKKTVVITVVSQPCAAAHMARYEALRRDALMRPRLTRRLGLTVLQQYGLAAWMAQWSKIAVPTPTASGAPARSPVLPDDINTEVIKVLAAMALGHLQEDRI